MRQMDGLYNDETTAHQRPIAVWVSLAADAEEEEEEEEEKEKNENKNKKKLKKGKTAIGHLCRVHQSLLSDPISDRIINCTADGMHLNHSGGYSYTFSVNLWLLPIAPSSWKWIALHLVYGSGIST